MVTLKNKLLIGAGTFAGVMAAAPMAFAEDGDSVIVSAVNSAVASVSADAAIVIGAAVGLGAIFWGAKVLWGKFRGMAK